MAEPRWGIELAPTNVVGYGFRSRAFYFFPVEIEAGQVFAKAVGVVGDFTLGTGDVEELAAGFAEGVGFLADLDDVI